MPTAAQLMVKCLENEGVSVIFGLPVEENPWSDDEGVSLIACPVDYSENLRLTDTLGHLDETL